MADWLRSMVQTFEYYIVDPITWRDSRKLDTVTSCTIKRDATVDTLGSATIDLSEDIGEAYIRAYLIIEQDELVEKIALGTFLVQTPNTEFDGTVQKLSLDAYTPLLELKENPPPIGYALDKTTNINIMEKASQLCTEHMRAPVVPGVSTEKLFSDFVANQNDTWLSFIRDLIANAKFEFDLDPLGKVMFNPTQEFDAVLPIWTYTDDNSSILHPTLSLKNDLYGIPNVVEVLYSTAADQHYYARVVNDDPSSPTSTVNRGREIVYRVTDSSIIGSPIKEIGGVIDYAPIQQYAEQLLKKLSSIQCEVSYTHAYCPVRVGDCVLLNYRAAGLQNVKAKVISQDIKCQPGTPVTETAIFKKSLWR